LPFCAHALDVAFHYGEDAPLDAMRTFDVIVVEPSHQFDPKAHLSSNAGQSALYAYVSIGEVHPQRAYRAAMPDDMLAGSNDVWKSSVVNQAHPDWPRFFVDQIIAPLWEQGYSGFFLDTMDSYQIIGQDSATIQAQQAGLVKAIEQLHIRFPNVKLIANRGFELLPRLAPHLQAVAAESLFGRWNQEAQRYVEVPESDRSWLLNRFEEVKKYGLEAISIDYINPEDRAKTRATANQILQLGITPFVTDGALISTGIGRLEVKPRRVLLLHNTTPPGQTEQESVASLKVVMPLQYLGYRVDMLDLNRYELPDTPLADRYAAVVAVFGSDDAAMEKPLTQFFERTVDQKVPLVFFNSFGVDSTSRFVRARLGLSTPKRALRAPMRIDYMAKPGVGEEIRPLPSTRTVPVKASSESTALLTLKDSRGQLVDGVATTKWGGYAVAPYTYIEVSKKGQHRWAFDPIRFLKTAIQGDTYQPAPDVTTKNGRRVLLIHIDGDGFASKAEIPGTPWAATVMYRDFIKRYKVPHTVSVIEGEVGPEGLYPQFSSQLEPIARDIFKLSHVELASHSYSHPFFWYSVTAAAERGESSSQAESLQHLPIEGYNFDLHRDIAGAVNYINTRLAPPGKKTKVFLWTGDCVPPPAALAKVAEIGLVNMNAGDTLMTHANPSLAAVAPMSIRKDGWLQVFAPNQNENVYTNDWTGPYYGFDRVIETFKLTNSPRRLKPINIYYHTYAASKSASIASLHRVYRYALSQPIHPLYGSEYIATVQDFENIATAREVGESKGQEIWRIAGNGALRTVRIPDEIAQRINWQQSSGLIGRKQGVDGTYIHLGAARARVVVDSKPQETPPHVVAANGQVEKFSSSANGFEFSFSSHVKGRLTLSHPPQCQVRAGKRRLKPMKRKKRQSSGLIHDYQIKKRDARSGILVSVRC
jgi:hypothetical protein